MDDFLSKRLKRYEKWISNNQIDYSSRVVPVSESIDLKQWVIPTKQALSILENARTFALTNCLCRTHYKRCDHPLDVCFLLNETAEKNVNKKLARFISLEEAKKAITLANDSGLVHLSLFQPDHEIFALCNCCSCCCHDLQLLIQHKRKDLISRSDFIAKTDAESCSFCGECIDRCVFGARYQKDDQILITPDTCYGCGLCVTTCPTESISMYRSP